MNAFEAFLRRSARHRRAAGLERSLSPREPESDVIDLSGNDYLGLARHRAVAEAAAEAALRWGAGATASRLVTGSLTLHQDLEESLADVMGQPSALVFSTGYQANLSAVSALADRDTVIVSDAHIHASLIDAARLSRSRVVVVPHNDVSAVAAALRGRTEPRAVVLSESIYSVLGDAAPLTELAAECDAADALLLVDEAHGLGTTGTHGGGRVHQLGLAGRGNVLVTATLSKSLGSQGGAVLGAAAIRTHLVNTARPFIYDTGLAPSAAAGALAALGVMRQEPDRVRRVRRNAAVIARSMGASTPAAAVCSVVMPSPESTVAAAARCLSQGVRVGSFRPPSVPDGRSRLRLTSRADLADVEIERALAVLSGAVQTQQSA